MSQSPAFKIRYWGATGTFSDPLLPHEVTAKIVAAIGGLIERNQLQDLRSGPGLESAIQALLERELPFHMRSTYGGNTTCLEVETEGELFVFDCGSGFRELGIELESRWRAQGKAARREAHVMLTHSHMDHTFATPFFLPYYNPANAFTMWGPQGVIDSLEAVLNPKSALSHIYFPPTYDEMKALHDFRPINVGADFVLGNTRITTYALNHPGGSMAYRLETAGRSLVFATDHEQLQVPDAGLAAFARGCDLLYTEGQYTQAEYEGRAGIGGGSGFSRRGWGHSPIESCVATALAAGVARLHVGHRDPCRSDAQIAEMDVYLQKLLRDGESSLGRTGSCQALIPHEGLELHIG